MATTTAPPDLPDTLEPAGPADVAGQAADDVEALLLCALLWTTGPQTATDITAAVTAGDFHSPTYGALFTVIAALAAVGAPHTPPMVRADLERAGRLHGHHGRLLETALRDVTCAGAPAEAARYFADAVLSQAYRRSYAAAAQSIAGAAAELPEHELFEHLLEVGRRQRTAWNRLCAFRASPTR